MNKNSHLQVVVKAPVGGLQSFQFWGGHHGVLAMQLNHLSSVSVKTARVLSGRGCRYLQWQRYLGILGSLVERLLGPLFLGLCEDIQANTIPSGNRSGEMAV